MNKWSELLLGLILVLVPIVVAWLSLAQGWNAWDISFNFWTPAWNFLKGAIFWFIVMVGALFILLGVSDLKG
jgi:TRAP-type C4-dicarboxylate transport system permease small subunit